MARHHRHSFFEYLIFPGLYLTDAHAEKKEIKMANKLAEKTQAEKDKRDEIMAEIAAGGNPDLTSTKASNVISSLNPLFGDVASIFGGGSKKKSTIPPALLIGGGLGLLLLLMMMFKSKK